MQKYFLVRILATSNFVSFLEMRSWVDDTGEQVMGDPVDGSRFTRYAPLHVFNHNGVGIHEQTDT